MTGLINRKTSKNLPLRSSSISADIKGFTARTTAVLTYYNDNRSEIEGLFVLPLDHTTTIVEFEAIIEGHYMFADVRDSVEVTDKRVLYETESLQDGLFKVSVGKISPWVIAEIQVTIICEITALFFGDALRYTLPQAFSPKVVASNDEYITDISTSTLGYCFNIEIKIEAPCLLYGVQSNTHPIQVDSPPLSETGAKLLVSIPEDFEPNDEVFELLMFLCRPREPYIVIEEAKQNIAEVTEKNPINSIMNNPILMLSYSPDISTFKHDLFDSSQSGEYLLLIDCCIREEINDIKESCILFLKSLPCNCLFNVLSFSSLFQSAFLTSQSYSCSTLENAMKFICSLKSNPNDISSLQPAIQWVFDQEDLAHTPKQLFIITSGRNNSQLPANVLQQARNKHHLARCFLFDVGTNRCTHILERLAAASRGRYCMLKENDKLQTQLMSCLKAAMQPVITDVNVSWILPEAYDVIYTPENLPSVFFGERLNLYAILATKETSTNIEKISDSVTSIKEFWFEDMEMFDDYEGSHQNLFATRDDEEEDAVENTVRRTQSLNIETSIRREPLDHDEVFLTEEEAKRLSNGMNYPKKLSLDRVQKWRVSRFPQNVDIDTDLSRVNDCYQHGSLKGSKEKIYCCRDTQLNLRKKCSLDGTESVGSLNSYSSNFSSSSHFYAFPGYPTRMSSCRSIEARSPHIPKHGDEIFNFQDTIKEKHLTVDRGSRNSLSENEASIENELRKKERCSHHNKPRQKLTEALVVEHVNTHLVDDSNENTIEQLLESAVNEKRSKLQDWLKVQEEMTQCLWPITDYEKEVLEHYEWRDSGIGNRSSSEARTSDLEEEVTNKKKRSSKTSVYFDDKKVGASWRTKSNDDIPDSLWPMKHIETTEQETKRKAITNTTTSKRKLKAKSMWNSIVDKVRSISAIVSDKSGETKFNRKGNASKHEDNTLQKRWQNYSLQVTTKTAVGRNIETANNSVIENPNKEKSKPSTERLTKKLKKGSLRNPPIIENSRTISTTSMFEIGKSEIGDVENLHLLPSQALIYLSGQCGQQVFKRIIPFQLEINTEGGGDSSTDITIHQLAAKSIIHDLEMQMEDDNMLESHGKLYIKHLIGEVSKAANVLSKYTAFVTIDDTCRNDEILSTLEYEHNDGHRRSCSTIVSPFKFQYEQASKRRKSSSHEDIYLTQRKPLYEIVKEPLNLGQPHIRKTRLHLKTPNLTDINTKEPRNVVEFSEVRLSPHIQMLKIMASDGHWELNQQFANAISVPLPQLKDSYPFIEQPMNDSNFFDQRQEVYKKIWATTIALSWLRSTSENAHDEWGLVEMKAKKWLSKKNLPKGCDLNDISLISQQTLQLLKGTKKPFLSRTQSLPKRL